jgi:drug/metabolite transporter (DMT)-like permease
MLTAAVAALGAALYGIADFLGGLTSRRASALGATIACQAVGFAVLALVALLFPPTSWSDPRLLWGIAAGASGGMGVLALYAGLAAGRMSVVAPVTASLAAALPALVGVVRGERLSAIGWSGIALALVAVVVVSVTPEHEPGEGHDPRRALLFAIIAGCGFAGAIVAYGQTPHSAAMVPLLLARVTTLGLLGGLVLVRRDGPALAGLRPAAGVAIAAGIADTAANTAQVVAIRMGPLAIAAVIGALYPAVTVLLARFVLRERLHGWQLVGIAMALVAVILTSWPG